MTFTEQMKQELLAELSFRKPCCRHAFCAGLLFSAKRDNGQIEIRVTGTEPAKQISGILSAEYGQAPTVRECSRFGRTSVTLGISSRAAVKSVSEFSDPGTPLLIPSLFRCEFCKTQFFKAIFLASGTVSDPEKENYLEFLLPDATRAAKLFSMLSGEGVHPRPVNRKSGCGLYFRSGGGVEDVLRLIGATQQLFTVLNIRISKEISNHENRATNCVTRNIEKTVQASLSQVAAVEKLIDRGILQKLSPELRATALLRIHHTDASLEELAAMHTPPISKSGLNHRLKRIMEEAESIPS